LWFTSPSDPSLSTRTGAFTFDCTPGADVAEEFAPWSTLFSPSCFCLLRCVCDRSPDEPPQQPEPACSAPCRCLELSPWLIPCPRGPPPPPPPQPCEDSCSACWL